jgi:hypothetical protein
MSSMPACDCCRIVIDSGDPDAMLIATRRRTIRLCCDHARVIIAMLADLQVDPLIEVIR